MSIIGDISQSFHNEVNKVKQDFGQLEATAKKQGSDLENSLKSFHNGHFGADLKGMLDQQLSDSSKTLQKAGKTWYDGLNTPSNTILDTVKKEAPSTARYINGYQNFTDNLEQGATTTISNVPKGIQNIGDGSVNVVGGLASGNLHQVLKGGGQIVHGVGDIPVTPAQVAGNVTENTAAKYIDDGKAKSAIGYAADRAFSHFHA
ncbi:hypothetical protein [Paraburkholderia humisilvae]|uniref:Uncharacterized protein n=1 Tax=Paraburkholderia humisilvae TaxID=627669 RepID=A0A6J5F9D3_9BURK|nr:hypothetical protein [Paraburkholderia humisilvae]CAB3775094.1 hypothetical protein LMG29542_08476 [Paraburkholderia humisilvae]